MSNIAANIAEIKGKISRINPKTNLIAVSKTKPIEDIREALQARQRLFGENKVQEAESKFPELRKEYPDLELHLIGPLQTNKVKEALQLFDVIQTLDREKLALEIKKQLSTTDQLLTKSFFIQVNIGEEPQKAGVSPQEAAKFFEYCTKELELNVTGLMCIPPFDENPVMCFALLKRIAQQLSKSANQRLMLSMGMSGDYMDAAELGADYIRVGSAIFGERVLEN